MKKINIKEIIATVAPALATALGGPLAGMATRAIAGELLGNPDRFWAGAMAVSAAESGHQEYDYRPVKNDRRESGLAGDTAEAADAGEAGSWWRSPLGARLRGGL